MSVGSFWKYARPEHSKASFQMTFFSFVFPNTALVTATFQIGRAFDCKAVEIAGCAMAGLLVLAWAFIFGMSPRLAMFARKYSSTTGRHDGPVHMEEGTFVAAGVVKVVD